MTHEIELDKGILEKLMSNRVTNEAEICQTKSLNSNNNNQKENNKIIYEGDDDDDDEDDDEFDEDDSLAPIINQDDILLPIVQVINIQNIATSAAFTKYNNKSSSSSCSSSSNETEETEESKNSKDKKKSNKHKNTLTNDRYLLILSDGEYYETRCLLLPNLNYMVNSSKLRKGSIIRLDRFELNLIPNGKILVIEQVTVLKNTINTNLNANDNERKSIMNNNLADTLKSIGIIGSLKPTSNNTQLKLRLQQQQQQLQTEQNKNNNNLNKNESTDKNNNKNKYKQEEDELDDDDEDDDDEYEDVDDEDEDEDEFEDDDADYEDDEDDDEEEDLDYEDEDDPNSEKNFKSVVDIILCKCTSCKEQNTLKLCYKLLGLDENASLEEVKEKYSLLATNSNDSSTVTTSNNNSELECDQSIECNLDKLIRKLLKKKIFSITNEDRLEIRTKAYNLILKIKSNDEPTSNVPINTLLSSLTISKANSILNNIDRKLLIRKRIVNKTKTETNNNNQEAQIEDYLQYAWMKIANEFIRHENQQMLTKKPDTSKNKKTNQDQKRVNENTSNTTNSNTNTTTASVKQMNELKNNKKQIEQTNTSSLSHSSFSHQHHHHHHHHHLNCRRKTNPKAFYQQIKKNNKTHSMKAMRNKQKQEAAAAAALATAAALASTSHTNTNTEVAVPSPFVYAPKQNEDNEEEIVAFNCKLGNFLVDFNNRPAVLNEILNDQNELKENENGSNKEEDLLIKTENTSLTISNNNNSTTNKRIEKDLEQHLDSLKLIKEKLSLSCENNETLSKPATAKKRKNDNSLIATTVVQSKANVEQDDENNEEEQETIAKHTTTSLKNNKKSKKKKNNKKPTTKSSSSQLNIAIPSFNLPLIKQKSSNDQETVLNEKLKLELEQEQLEKQLIEQQKLQQLQIEQLQKQIDEFESESAVTGASASTSSNEQSNALEAVLNENDLSQVLNNLSEALVKTNENENKNINESLNSLKSLDRIEKLKKIESIEKAFYAQDFSAFKQQQQQSSITTEILKSKLIQLENKKLNKKCLSCSSKTSEQSLSLIKLKNKRNDHEEEEEENEDEQDTDENDSLSDDNEENNNTNNKDQFNIIIMKQTKNENKLKQSLILNKNEKKNILIKDVVKRLSLVNQNNEDDDEEEDEEEEDDDEDDDEYYEDEDNDSSAKNSMPSVEELIKTIHDDEENIIFVQSLSSLAKKTLFNQQLNQQRKLKRKQQSNKDIVIESNTIIRLGSSEQIKSETSKTKQTKKTETVEVKKENKLDKKLSESSTTTSTVESAKLTKNQKKRLKKQMNKKNSLVNTTTNSESVPETVKEATPTSETPKSTTNENLSIKNSKKKKQNENEKQVVQVNEATPPPPLPTTTTTTTSSNSKKNKKSKKKSSETNENKNKPKEKSPQPKQEVEKAKPIQLDLTVSKSKPISKKINDISDFSEDEDLKELKHDSEDTQVIEPRIDTTNKQKIESTNEDSDQGDWVKVAGNRLLITETKKPKKQTQPQQTTTKSSVDSTSKKPVKISSSLNSLDSFTTQDVTIHMLKKSLAIDSDTTTKSKQTVDFLIPSTIDEEDEMLKKALELSLKETKMNSDNSSTTKASSTKLGLDDFNDDAVPLKSKTVASQMNVSNKNVALQQAKPAPISKPINQVPTKINLAKPPVVVSQTNTPSNRPVNTSVTSFAAAAASQPKSKQTLVSSTVLTPSQSVNNLNQQTKQPFKWNKPNETVTTSVGLKTNLIEQVVKPTSSEIVKRKISSSSTKEFKDNGVDLPLPDVVVEKQNSVTSLPFVTSNLEQLSLNSFEKKDDKSLKDISASISNPFLTINNLFSSTSSNNVRLDENKTSLYGLVGDISKSSLITPSNNVTTTFGTLPTISIVGSNLIPPDQTSQQANTISPIKKPIGAERSLNTQRSTNSISPPLIKLPISASNALPNAGLVHPIRPASTASSSTLTPAKPLTTQLSASNTSLNTKQAMLPQTSDLTNSLSPNQLNLADSLFKPELAPNQKQMIRVPPQQKLSNNLSTQPIGLPSIDQFNKPKPQQQIQQQQQQQQQQQTFINNLIMLLANNNNNIDPSQLANIILYLNQLMSQQPQTNSSEHAFQSNQQKLNDTTNLLLKSLTQQQEQQNQQQQQSFNTNQSLGWNNFDSFSQQNLFNKPTVHQTSILQQQQQPPMFLNQTKPTATGNLWQNNDYQFKSNYGAGLLTSTNSTTTPSPPPITNSTTSSSSSIIMQSGSSTSSSPSPHLINPIINPNANQYSNSYNYFGNIGNNNKPSLIQTVPNQNLIVGPSNMQYRSNNNNTGVNQLYSSFNTNNMNSSASNTNYLFNSQNSFFSMNNNTNNVNSNGGNFMSNLSSMTTSNSNSNKLLPNPIGLRSTNSNSTQHLNTPVTQIPKNPF